MGDFIGGEALECIKLNLNKKWESKAQEPEPQYKVMSRKQALCCRQDFQSKRKGVETFTLQSFTLNFFEEKKTGRK